MNGVAFEPGFSRQLGDLAPYLIVAGGGLAAMLADAFRHGDRSGGLFGLSLVTLLGAAFAYLRPSGSGSDTLLGGMLANDPYTGFFGLLFLGIALLTLVFGAGPFGRAGVRGDFYPVLLFATLGMMVLAAANDFLSLYLGLETMSLATYVLVGGRKGSAHSSEAGFKYLLLGGFASAFLLFGIALTFGFAGSTSLDVVRAALAAPNHEAWLLAAGGGLILIGFGFKIAMVPFHMWTPDVYDGAPSHVTGFMATGIKAAAFASLLRVTLVLLPAFSSFWFPLLAVLAVVTMTLGNLVALAQTNLKRLLAYSSIAHAGYLLLGVLALLVPHTRQGHAAAEAAGGGVLFYLVGYAVMNLAAFGIVSFLGNPAPDRESDADDLRGYAGLARRQPLAAAALAIALFSLAGIPPTVGFMGKFYVFDAVVRSGLVPLAIWGVVNSLVSVYYYLRVVVTMYMAPADETAYDGRSWSSALAVSVLAALVVVLGILPGGVHRVAEAAFRAILG